MVKHNKQNALHNTQKQYATHNAVLSHIPLSSLVHRLRIAMALVLVGLRSLLFDGLVEFAKRKDLV